MQTFRYRARSREGEILTSTVEAADIGAAAEHLRDEGLLVIQVEAHRDTAHRRLLDMEFDPFGRSRSRDIVVFTRQLATMTGAGIPLVRSLGVLASQTESRSFSSVVTDVGRSIEEDGLSFSGSLARHEKIFGRLYVEMIRAGESGGALDSVLLRVATQLEREQALARQVRSATAYPLFVLATALLAAVFMLAFVVPVFEGMYADLGGTLPLPTQVAVFLSGAVVGVPGLISFGAIILASFGLRRFLASENGRRWLEEVMIRLPLGFGGLVRKIALARVSRTLGSLISAGVPILHAIEVSAAASGNARIESALLRSRDAVGRGLEVHAALAAEKEFPHLVVRMVAVGEESGNLDGMLSKVADFYESEVEAAVGALTSMLEPALIVVVGAIVGATIISMYLPMFGVFELI